MQIIVPNSVGVSIASYLPHSVINPRWAIFEAAKAQAEFLQLIPLRRLGVLGNFNNLILPVKYVEKAWNPPPRFFRAAFRQLKGDMTNPFLLWAIFGPQSDKIYNQIRLETPAQPVRHDFEPTSGLVEIFPGMWLTLEEIVSKLEELRSIGQSIGVTLDLYNIRRPPTRAELTHRPRWIRHKSSLLGPWQEIVDALLPHTKLVHVQPNRSGPELHDCLAGLGTEIEEMLLYIKQKGWVGDYVVEAVPQENRLGYRNVADVASGMIRWTKRVLV